MSGSGTFQGGAMLNNLAALGVQPEQVTDVIFTHLHFDHVGWASADGVRVFPNAVYRCDARDWEHFRDTSACGPLFRRLPSVWRRGRTADRWCPESTR